MKLLEHFVASSTTRTTAEVFGVNKNTAQLFFHKMREILAKKNELGLLFAGEIEADESYFGGKRKGKLGGMVFAEIISDAKSKTLFPIIKEKVVPDSIVYTDLLPSYNVLGVSKFKHFWINHSKLFAEKHNHINGIENFWTQAKRHMSKFNGILQKKTSASFKKRRNGALIVHHPKNSSLCFSRALNQRNKFSSSRTVPYFFY